MAKDLNYEAVAEKLKELSSAVAELSHRLSEVERSLAEGRTVATYGRPPTHGAEAGPKAKSEKPPLLGGVGEVFARLAWVCFLLVIALILRTLAATDLLGLPFGIWTGIAYASAVTVVGWALVGRQSKHGSTVAVTGVLLVGSILMEATFRHQLLPGTVSYGVLLLAATAGTLGAGGSASLALGGASFVLLVLGVALLFVTPHFPLLALLVLVLNAAAGRQPERRAGSAVVRALLWLAFVAIWSYWGLEISSALRRGGASPAGLHSGWLGPLLLLALVYFAVSAVREALRLRNAWLDALDASLLPLTLSWAHALSLWVVVPVHGAGVWVGAVELALALLLLASCEWAARREERGGSGAGVLAPSGAVAFYLAVWVLMDESALAPLVWTCGAGGLVLLSRHWQSGGARAASYGLVFVGAITSMAATPTWAGTGPFLAAGVAGSHYRWLRRHPAPASSRFFGRVDRGDTLRILVLLSAVIYLLTGLQALVHPVLGRVTSDVASAGTCVWTLWINLAALALLVYGQRRDDREVRGLGVFLMVVGAGKVFLYDLLATAGLPLVGSVSSFGVAAAVGAAVLRKRAPTAADPVALAASGNGPTDTASPQGPGRPGR